MLLNHAIIRDRPIQVSLPPTDDVDTIKLPDDSKNSESQSQQPLEAWVDPNQSSQRKFLRIVYCTKSNRSKLNKKRFHKNNR